MCCVALRCVDVAASKLGRKISRKVKARESRSAVSVPTAARLPSVVPPHLPGPLLPAKQVRASCVLVPMPLQHMQALCLQREPSRGCRIRCTVLRRPCTSPTNAVLHTRTHALQAGVGHLHLAVGLTYHCVRPCSTAAAVACAWAQLAVEVSGDPHIDAPATAHPVAAYVATCMHKTAP